MWQWIVSHPAWTLIIIVGFLWVTRKLADFFQSPDDVEYYNMQMGKRY
jgi:hypothetical protein